MLKKIKWDETATAARNAARKLPTLVKEYFTFSRTLIRRKHSAVALHRFRMRTRRLRYTLELFQSCYGPGLTQRLAALRRLEKLAQELHDCTVARRILDGRLLPRSPHRTRLLHILDDREGRKLEEFRQSWTEEVDADGQERAWREYLARAR